MLWLAVASGGALGSMARFATSLLVGQWASGAFPWGTLAANVIGCFTMGLLASVLVGRSDSAYVRAFLLTGFLGGYTTFSSFANETLHLARHDLPWLAVANVIGTVTATLVAVWIGYRLVGP